MRRSPSWNPATGRINPWLLVIAGSSRTTATSRGSSARATASRSLNGTTLVCSVTSGGSPSSSGTSRPSSRVTRAWSKWPWYLPSNSRTLGRAVATRATRMSSVLACDADNVNCHFGKRHRRASSSATQIESSTGSRNWLPALIRRETASTTGSGAYPQNMLMSATLKSTYSWPSTHRKREPVPSVTHTGRWSYVAGSASQAIGTPFGIDARARSSRSRERGWATRNRSSSLAFRRRTTSGSTVDMSGDSPGSHWVAPTGGVCVLATSGRSR